MVEEAAEDGTPLEVMVTSGQERTLDHARTPSRDLPISFQDPDGQKCRILEGGESEDGERRENRIESASKVIIAVAVVDSIAVTKLHVAPILLLVDPLHDVLMAKV